MDQPQHARGRNRIDGFNPNADKHTTSCDSHANTHCNCNRNAHSNPNTNTHTHCNRNGYAHTRPPTRH